jgi:hypothetical protein
MNDIQVRHVAEAFVSNQESKFVYEFVGVTRSPRFPSEANVSFTVKDSESGTSFDGPVVVIVDEQTESARFFQ